MVKITRMGRSIVSIPVEIKPVFLLVQPVGLRIAKGNPGAARLRGLKARSTGFFLGLRHVVRKPYELFMQVFEAG